MPPLMANIIEHAKQAYLRYKNDASHQKIQKESGGNFFWVGEGVELEPEHDPSASPITLNNQSFFCMLENKELGAYFLSYLGTLQDLSPHKKMTISKEFNKSLKKIEKIKTNNLEVDADKFSKLFAENIGIFFGYHQAPTVFPAP